jgi:ABC-type Mn2+/Zn2+ transport system permease subunit
VSLLAALLLAIAGAWAYTRRQLPQSAVICGGAVLGTLLTMLVSAYIPLNHAGFWYSTKFSRLAPVVVGLMLGALMNFGGRFLSERSGLKSWRVWTSAAIVCAGIIAISRVQNSAIDLESVLLSTITRDTRSDLSLMKYTAIAAFVPMGLHRSSRCACVRRS